MVALIDTKILAFVSYLPFVTFIAQFTKICTEGHIYEKPLWLRETFRCHV